jgi:DNA polymerase-3 subunit beta
MTNLIEGKFPDYEGVLPMQRDYQIRLGRQALQTSLQRVAIMTTDKFKGVRLNLEPHQLAISANNPEQEEAIDNIDIDYQGPSIEIGFNVTYLLDVLSNLTQEMVDFSFSKSENESILITTPEDKNFKYVVMPLRI